MIPQTLKTNNRNRHPYSETTNNKLPKCQMRGEASLPTGWMFTISVGGKRPKIEMFTNHAVGKLPDAEKHTIRMSGKHCKEDMFTIHALGKHFGRKKD